MHNRGGKKREFFKENEATTASAASLDKDEKSDENFDDE